MSAPADSTLFLTLLDGSGQADTARPPAELPRKGKLIVGSSQERADFVVAGQGIAEVHCAIGRLKTGGWALKDLGSDFGTLLNGERIETARLETGDELLIGSRKLRIVADALAERVAPTAAASKAAPVPRETPRADAPRSASVSIAGYSIEGELGRGAMGRVLRATQTSLDRKVAVKVLAPKLAGNATFVDRFRKEARAAAPRARSLHPRAGARCPKQRPRRRSRSTPSGASPAPGPPARPGGTRSTGTSTRRSTRPAASGRSRIFSPRPAGPSCARRGPGTGPPRRRSRGRRCSSARPCLH